MACTPAPRGTSIADIVTRQRFPTTTTRCCRVNFHSPAHLFHTTRKFGGASGESPDTQQYEQQITSQWTDVRHLHWRLPGPTHHRGHQHGAVHAYRTNFEGSFELNPCPSSVPKRPDVFFHLFALLTWQKTTKTVNFRGHFAASRSKSSNMSEPSAISIAILYTSKAQNLGRVELTGFAKFDFDFDPVCRAAAHLGHRK